LDRHKLLPVASLLFAATFWGIVWYPYRLLENAGIGGELSTLVTYIVALIAVTLVRPRAWHEFRNAPISLIVVALASGWCNLAYVLGMLTGEVMHVLLLFYLAPLWTVPIARLLLKERVTAIGYMVVLLSLGGAIVMLWNPSLGSPMPSTTAEWLGLSSGFCFALANVSVRRVANCGVTIKTLCVFAGVILASLGALWVNKGAMPSLTPIYEEMPLVFLIGGMLVAMSFATNFGISHMQATRAIVIMLFELVVAAFASYFLAGEVMELKEWIGGIMIVIASLFSGHIHEKEQPSQ